MRLMLLLEPAFALTLVALLARYAHEPCGQTAVAIGVVAVLAMLPFVPLLQRKGAVQVEAPEI